VDGHLVAVEVGVERRTDQRMKMDRLTLDESRLERLDAEPVQRRRAVQHHRMPVDHRLEDIPHLVRLPLDDLLGRLHGLDMSALDQLPDDERLEELDGHILRQAALVQAHLGTDHDNRTTGIVDALAEQVLTEATLLSFQDVGERLQRARRVGAGR
jgi:hypothetical protein